AKMIATLYYPGYNSDNALSTCTDPQTGQRVNKQDKFLPVLAQSNWRACNLAAQNGFACVDDFAQYMGADYDSNGDGQIDSDALRYQQGESEADYVNRISVTLRSTIRDSNTHFVSPSTSFDYLQSDDTHPTYFGSATIGINIFTGSGSGSGAPDFSGGQIVGGKNPQWNQGGHERMGWGLSVFNPATPRRSKGTRTPRATPAGAPRPWSAPSGGSPTGVRGWLRSQSHVLASRASSIVRGHARTQGVQRILVGARGAVAHGVHGARGHVGDRLRPAGCR